MIEKFGYKDEPKTRVVARIVGFTTLVLGETASVVAGVAEHSVETYEVGTLGTLGASLLATVGVLELFDRPDPPQ